MKLIPRQLLVVTFAIAAIAIGTGGALAASHGRTVEYQVVVNHEEQYVIFPVDWDLPSDWKPVGMSGSLEKCHAYIEEVWTDMRPLSVRREYRRDVDYRVIVNQEGQHAAWPAARDVPSGWKGLDRKGPLEECQAYIEEVWTDMRPLSVQRALSRRR